jgi:transposase
MENLSTKRMPVKAAGIDMSKLKFDVAVHGSGERFGACNDGEGHRTTAERLAALGVTRVGIEASGHYEAALASYLRQAGFTVIILDPAQVHGYRRFAKKRAKTDAIDATLVAAVTAAVEQVREAPDPRLAAFAEHLTLIEQIGEDIARLKTRRDRFTDKAHRHYLESEIARLTRRRDKERIKLLGKVLAHADLKRRYELALSVPGIGEGAALGIVVRMPELGHMRREEAAALLGVAPFNVDSGEHAGERHIAGGRARLRKTLYLAAFAACHHWNEDLQAFYKRLREKGKHAKTAVIACTRKLITLVNAVLARGTPWVEKKVSP